MRLHTRLCFWLTALLLLVGGKSPGQESAPLRSDEYGRAVSIGMSHLYRLEYSEAVRAFDKLEEDFPYHPGPPLARALARWNRELFFREEFDLERFVSPGYFMESPPKEMDEAERKAFFLGVESARSLAEERLRVSPDDVDATYYLGACEAALGVFAFTIDRKYLDALRHGKAAYEIHRDLIERRPDYADSYMTVGTYEYIAGNLPWYVKWIAAIVGFRGSESRGFEYLIRSAKQGFLVRDDARVLLMALYVREREYDYALQLATELHARYPENFVIHLNRVQLLERLGRTREAAETLAEAVRLAESKSPNYQMLELGRFRYPLGQRLLELGRSEEALVQFRQAIQDSDTNPEHRVMSHLRAGELLDARGERAEAIRHFRSVQELEDVNGSHRAAARYLRKR